MMELREFFSVYPKVALAFSGGADSAYLLWAAREYGADVKAYYLRSEFQPAFEYEDAKRLAAELGLELETVELDVLSVPEVAANPTDRCYHCKRVIFGAIKKAAKNDGYTVIIDGTNASDDYNDRPGMRVLEEMGILSPLRLCGIGKDELRKLSKQAGIFTWDKPSYSCLATRMQPGKRIRAEELARVEKAEELLRSLGFDDLRLRLREGYALLQLPEARLQEGRDRLCEIQRALSGIFPNVRLDEKGR